MDRVDSVKEMMKMLNYNSSSSLVSPEYWNFPIQSKNDYWKEVAGVWSIKLKYPGVNKELLKVTVRENTFTIEIKEDTEFFSKGNTREFYLPNNCKRSSLKANISDGVLNVTVGKKYTDFEVKVD